MALPGPLELLLQGCKVIDRKHIHYRKGYKYQSAESFICHVNIFPDFDIITEFIQLRTDGTLFIRKGYAWDGASGPTYDDRYNMRGSLVHDALYQLIRHGLIRIENREVVDEEFYLIIIEDGMNSFRAWYYWKAVGLFGNSSADKKAIKKIYEAP